MAARKPAANRPNAQGASRPVGPSGGSSASRSPEPSIRDVILRWLRYGPRTTARPTTTRRVCVGVVRPVLLALLAEGAVERRPGKNGGWVWSVPDEGKSEGGVVA